MHTCIQKDTHADTHTHTYVYMYVSYVCIYAYDRNKYQTCNIWQLLESNMHIDMHIYICIHIYIRPPHSHLNDFVSDAIEEKKVSSAAQQKIKN